MLRLEVSSEVMFAAKCVLTPRDFAREAALVLVHGLDVHFEVVAPSEP